jgi:site-specific DNA recombinase
MVVKCTTGRPVRVVFYIRYSDKKSEENSPERQLELLTAYAGKRGWVVVAVYKDEAIPGDEWDLARRKDFRRMLDDAQRGLFDVILVDDQDRFGRFDSLTAGEIINPLRRVGVRLEAIAQGPVDWESFAGRITDAVLREAKQMESRSKSRNVLNTALRMARGGKHTGGKAPYGMDLVDGKLAPNGKARNVQLAFDLIDQGGTLGTAMEELYQRGIPSPGGKPRWSRKSLLKILTQRKYAGDWVWGVHAVGKYHRQAGGKAETTERGAARFARNDKEDWIVIPDHHPAVIDREQFVRVQARLKGNRGRTSPVRGGGPFILTRLLVCGHCGSFMRGGTQHGKREYRCAGYLDHGKGFCNSNTMEEGTVLGAVVNVLQRTFLNPEHLGRLREEIRKQEEAETDPGSVDGLRRRIEALGRKIDQGTDAAMLAPATHQQKAWAKVGEWEAERDKLVAELERVTKRSRVADLEEQIAAIESHLWDLREAVRGGDPGKVKALLQVLVAKVELHFEHKQTACQSRPRFVRGVIHLAGAESRKRLVTLRFR